MSHALDAFVIEVEQDPSLLEPGRLRERGEVLDRLETYLGCDFPGDHGSGPRVQAGLRERMLALCGTFEAIDSQLYRSIRDDIKRGQGAARLLAWITDNGPGGHADKSVAGDSYDYLDVLISGVLQLDEPATQIAELP